MKLLSLLSASGVALSAVANAAPHASAQTAPQELAPVYLTDAQADALVAAGSAIEPELASEKPKDGGKRATISYGPYNLPANGASDPVSIAMEKPCTECYITAIEAALTFNNGTVATAANGFWLHHMVLSNSKGVFFASGNERTPTRLNRDFKYGMYIPAQDEFFMVSELMSDSMMSEPVKVALTYEYIPEAQATGYKAAYMLWEDIGYPPAREGVYNFTTLTTQIPQAGKLLWTNGHVHDGGIYTIMNINHKVVCNSTQLYGRRPGYIEPPSNMPGMAKGATHISDASVCMNFGEVKQGDLIDVQAYYNTNLHPLMLHNGKAEELMGINRVYIGP